MTSRAVGVNGRDVNEHRVNSFGQRSNLHIEPGVKFSARFDSQPVVSVREHTEIKPTVTIRIDNLDYRKIFPVLHRPPMLTEDHFHVALGNTLPCPAEGVPPITVVDTNNDATQPTNLPKVSVRPRTSVRLTAQYLKPDNQRKQDFGSHGLITPAQRSRSQNLSRS